jgi:hypothetical protein
MPPIPLVLVDASEPVDVVPAAPKPVVPVELLFPPHPKPRLTPTGTASSAERAHRGNRDLFEGDDEEEGSVGGMETSWG